MEHVDLVLCYSQKDREMLARLTGVAIPHARIVKNGVPLELFRQTVPASRKPKSIVWAGRMVRGKGLATLLKSVRKIADRIPEVRLVIVGDGPWAGELWKTIRALGIQRHVSVLGSVPFESMPSIYNSAAVCVVSSSTEGMPRTLMEAAACGVPVVATRLPQLEEFEGRGVLLFEPASADDLSECILRILLGQQMAEDLSRRARELAIEEFDWNRTVSDTTAACCQLLKEGQPGATNPGL